MRESIQHHPVVPCALTAASVFTRLYNIREPDHVCWDETHFGKMASWYINRTFFFDVHPPLGKMLIGLAGHLTGYNGSFPFSKPGEQYNNTPYVGMRMFCALIGSLVVPLSYGIVWELTSRATAAFFAAILILLDSGTLTLSRYILLDPMLLCFIMASMYSLLRFQNVKLEAFSWVWYFWLGTTGIFITCSVGVKFVGLFTVLVAGISTANDLWRKISNINLPIQDFLKHLLARIVGLILMPFAMYALLFWIHLAVLNKSGTGDGFFSSSFQSQLEGNPLYQTNMPTEVAYGSVVTIKNHRTAGAYLHSHWHLYPEGVGARQQQVTTYSHKDENNKWVIKRFERNPEENETVEYVKSGDLVRLEHVMTRRNLHSHREMAPVSKKQYQVTCYGENGTGDANDVFRLEIQGVHAGDHLKTVKSVFRLIHMYVGCAVQSHNKKLPKWGWEQLEVACNPKLRDKKSLWTVEEVWDRRLPNGSFEIYAPSFTQKFFESHAVMAQGNSGLKPKEGEVTSQPWQWILNYRGQPFSGPDFRIYLLGNPVIWWMNIAAMVIYVIVLLGTLVISQRLHWDYTQDSSTCSFIYGGTWLLLAWAFHYLPFFTMTRVLYFHHYFPAFLFGSMLSALVIDYFISKVMSYVKSSYTYIVEYFIITTITGVYTYSFIIFSPLSYGMTGPRATEEGSQMYGLRWLDSWDI